jgi:transketolase
MFELNRDKTNNKEMRMAVVESIIDLIGSNDKVIALEADLGAASGFSKIKKAHPTRFVNVGIAEANMMGIAAGLSLTGFIPFVHTFGPFASRRAFDQLFLSGGYSGNTINVYASDPGFTVGPNGGTHTTFEDVALFRAIPNSIVCDAADFVQMQWIVKKFAALKGIHCVRGNRKAVANVYKENSQFELGKGNILKKGKDILIVSAGQLVSDALDAADILEKDNISAEVIDMFCIKPIDAELLLKESKGKKAIISFENHSITGGLGSAIAEILAENGSAIPLKRMGVNERFGQVGSPSFLQKEFGLTAQNVVDVVKAL